MGRANESKVYFVKSLMFSCYLSYFHNALSPTVAFYCRTVHQISQRRLFFSLSFLTFYLVSERCQSTMRACASEVTKRLKYSLEEIVDIFTRVVCLEKSNIFLSEWPFLASIQKYLVSISGKRRNFSEIRLVLRQ